MAWSWSHTTVAYEAVHENIRQANREFLEIAYAEWKGAEDIDRHPQLNDVKYDLALAEAKTLDNETLADYIWERTSDYQTCDNGGFLAHCCPFGCEPHKVPFHVPSAIKLRIKQHNEVLLSEPRKETSLRGLLLDTDHEQAEEMEKRLKAEGRIKSGYYDLELWDEFAHEDLDSSIEIA
jgi:hypothetical protein